MTHLFKITLLHADLFVSEINMEEKRITFQLYSKEGQPIDVKKRVPFVVQSGNFIFDSPDRIFPAHFMAAAAAILERGDEVLASLETGD